MPNDVKAIVSIVTLLVAAGFGWWEHTVGKAVPFWYVMGFGVFAVIAMWVFPEAGVKKGDVPGKTRGGQS